MRTILKKNNNTQLDQLPEDIKAGFRSFAESGFSLPANDSGLVTNAQEDYEFSSISPRYNDDGEGPILIPVPRVIEQSDRGERAYDLYSRLLIDRIIMINRDFDDRLSNLVTAQLLFLQSQDPEKPIHIYINSPGGVVTAGLAIYDTMQHVNPPIYTTVIGQAASMGSVILLAGEKGHRYALPNARVMIHQPSGGSRGTSVDIEIQTRETVRIRETLYRIMAEHTGRTEDEIYEACLRDHFLSPEESIEFGILDNVLEPKKLKDLRDDQSKK